MSKAYTFPAGFLWGAATAAHQVEGDNRASDWWQYEERGRLPHRSGDACRHYRLFERDFDLAKRLGHNAHRFSIEWSRVEPVQGSWNADALDHYRDVVRALRARGLEPVVTLHHFTNPAWFLRRGGWTRHDAVGLFAQYVERVARAIGGSVQYWLTINEPTVYVAEGYVLGEWPPCLTGAWLKGARAFRHLARAHVAAYRILHASRADAIVGFAHSAPVVQPCDPARWRDRFAARMRDTALNRVFFRLIRARRDSRAHGPIDFVAINYYTRQVVRGGRFGRDMVFGRDCRQPHHGNDGPRSALGWEVYPSGFLATLERFSRYRLPIIVTENGMATDDDEQRREFIHRHLAALGQAVERGIDVRGYFHWTLIDNFEWAHGTTKRFGLAAVDASTQERIVKPSALDFERVCRENRLVLGQAR